MSLATNMRKFQGQENRRGQQLAFDKVRSNKVLSFLLCVLPTGYGKTRVLILTYLFLRSIGRCDRLLVVVASDPQRKQMIRDLQALFGKRKVSGWTSSPKLAKYNRRDQVELVVATINQVHSASRARSNGMLGLMEDRGIWMVAADEKHHYGEGMAWGDALQVLVDEAEFTLALTATPRRDGPDTIFPSPEECLRKSDCDCVVVTYREAKDEKAVKNLRLHRYEYEVEIESSDGERRTLSSGDLRSEYTAQQIEELRFHSRYVQPLLRRPSERLIKLRSETEVKWKMLVRAMACSHARHIAQTLSVHFKGLSVDWVGTGPNGRPDDENDLVLKRFKEGDLDVLIQVGMVGEGFDVPTISEIVDFMHVTLEGSSNNTKQFVGRGARVIKGFESIPCNVSVGTDHPLAEIGNLIDWMDSDVRSDGRTGPPTDDDDREWWETWTIPPVSEITERVSDAELRSIHVDDEDLQEFAKRIESSPAFDITQIDVNDPEHASALRDLYLSTQATIASEENREAMELRVRENINSIVKAIATHDAQQKILSGSSSDSFADLFKRYIIRHNAALKRQFNYKSRDDLTIDELRVLESYVVRAAEERRSR